ncbi:UDP-N-acetylmuramoyl-L-alanine--D-glutamate ligase [Mesonia aestuariivivens]|uniref:UDP-N-acetylmuramoylalanine--D-glutamate ligase n=1 Tax=Mesonia aestuariivivens TaxID=2796128 RepID=A0ABS6W569_9FLAO|nr:UDP-N-acetylmuramoyl-L-alanine--D-glutamate ligase [Mesonia aestuariivivens]MBW2962636.1 UDP-N-acetylmuramoyl-L-alanine--D-glutamate ligase [Mesonia aestuariivivens]
MKRLVVLGGGESGVGTALLGKAKGYEVFVSDKGKIAQKYKEVLVSNDIDWEEEKHTEALILNANVVMKSPGIPEKVEIVQKLFQKEIPVISEIEFASAFTKANLIGITGSNGKTTTATWVDYVLENAGVNVALAGNIGDSFAKAVLKNQADFYVLELSSFQLDGIEDFKPHIAVLTNITPDHLDRYNYKYENYIASKFRIIKNQTENDYFIYDADNPTIAEWIEKFDVKAKKLPLTFQKKVKEGAYADEQNIVVRIVDNEFIMAREDLALKGEHNTKNAMAASTVAQLLKIKKQIIRESMGSFQGVEHRLERVLKINNVQYINDSKATNINATYYALESVSAETIWIVGGVDKGNKYEELLPLVNEKVKAVICLGVDNARIKEVFGNCVENFVETQSMKEAVQLAYQLGKSGDTVLLSPACASFDLFENYEDRGRQFKNNVRDL